MKKLVGYLLLSAPLAVCVAIIGLSEALVILMQMAVVVAAWVLIVGCVHLGASLIDE